MLIEGVPWHACGSQRTPCRSWFSPSTLWAPGIKKFGSKCLYPQTYLSGPVVCFCLYSNLDSLDRKKNTEKHDFFLFVQSKVKSIKRVVKDLFCDGGATYTHTHTQPKCFHTPLCPVCVIENTQKSNLKK